MLGTKVKKHVFLWTAVLAGGCKVLCYDFRGKYKKTRSAENATG